ncbi:hypothetical protein [Streptomyces sp. DASNCL29]|nr:hypothetical protein [Streptomyces sp. DASNCL29]
MVRELSGDPRMHFDEVVREFPGIFFDRTPTGRRRAERLPPALAPGR